MTFWKENMTYKAIPWNQVPTDELIDGIKRQVVTGEKVMIGRIVFPMGAKVPAHTHESEQITHVLKGKLRFIVEGNEVIVSEGETLSIPSNLEHSAEALEPTEEIYAFSPIRTDWLDVSDIYLRS